MKYLKILLVSIMILGCMPIALVTTSIPVEAQILNEWDELGNVTGQSFIKLYDGSGYRKGSTISGTLYVKTSGFNTFYKIRIGNSNYNVSRTNEMNGYNAKFTYQNTVFYLSI